MKTKRIYYDDAFVREFEAEVLTCEEHAGNAGNGGASYWIGRRCIRRREGSRMIEGGLAGLRSGDCG